MANSDAPFGLRPVSTLTGGDYKGKVTTVSLAATYATNVFVGDAVKIAGSADASGLYPSVEQCAAGENIDYVIVSFDADFDNEDLNTLYGKASTARTAKAIPVNDIIFAIQEDSDGGALAATDVGSVADIIVGSGSTITGISGVELDSSTAATGASAQLTILGLSPDVDNEIGTNAVWYVRVNESNLTPGSDGI